MMIVVSGCIHHWLCKKTLAIRKDGVEYGITPASCVVCGAEHSFLAQTPFSKGEFSYVEVENYE